MENLLAFGIGIATCLVIGGAIYCIIVFRQLDKLTEEIEDDLDDLRGELNKFKREVENKNDVTSEVNERIDKLATEMNDRLDELDEDLEEVEKQINQLQVKQ
jgi:septal ring factor EnvC (AmiA/AmiB activator)